MLRLLKFGSVALVFTLLILSCQSATAQGSGTFQLGPLVADGFGATPQEAQQAANANMFDIIVFIESSLPPGHEVVGFEVLTEGFADPLWFTIEFMVNIEYVFDPKVPSFGY